MKPKQKGVIIAAGLLFTIAAAAFMALLFWKEAAEPAAYQAPSYAKEDLSHFFTKKKFSEKEYRSLYYQTGFSRRAVEELAFDKRAEVLTKAQEAFFTKPQIECVRNSPISWEERNAGEILPVFGNLEEGDILVTFCSHTYGWRNGHTGMVVDAQKGLTLESVVMGEPSCIQSLEKWRKYPSFIVLRLQGEGRKERQAIAQHALEKMQGIPYGFWSDFLEHFGLEELVADTDCSHLIWQVYKEFGYDLDSDDGIFVTPKDIAMSEHLEVVQMYGIDMNEIIERGE